MSLPYPCPSFLEFVMSPYLVVSNPVAVSVSVSVLPNMEVTMTQLIFVIFFFLIGK